MPDGMTREANQEVIDLVGVVEVNTAALIDVEHSRAKREGI
jgi:hypothetical protein